MAGPWWAAIYGVAESRTRLKRLSSSSSSIFHTFQSTKLLLFNFVPTSGRLQSTSPKATCAKLLIPTLSTPSSVVTHSCFPVNFRTDSTAGPVLSARTAPARSPQGRGEQGALGAKMEHRLPTVARKLCTPCSAMFAWVQRVSTRHLEHSGWRGRGRPPDHLFCVCFYKGANPIHEGSTSNGIAAATAAESLQSCPTLCDPIDCSPPGSSVPGILQARTLEWVAISFSNA